MLRALIIDDELASLNAVTIQIRTFCPNVSVISTCQSAEEGFKLIAAHQPDLLFLDIEMPGMTGIEMLEQIQHLNFGVIFITAYNKYAINAIKLSALDYLLKPIDPDELIKAVEKAEKLSLQKKDLDRYKLMLELLESPSNAVSKQKCKIALPTFERIIYEKMENIIRIEGFKNYCKFYCTSIKDILISKNIGTYDEALDQYDFMRIHRSHIVNLHHVKQYIRQDGGAVQLIDNTEIPVSKNKKDLLLERLRNL